MDFLKSQPIWITWRAEVVNERKTKVPYKKDFSLASSTDPQSWCTYEEARISVIATKKSGIGIVFENSCHVVGIDFDHCIKDSSIPPWLEDFLTKSNTYCEFSPSKTGCHVLFILKNPPDILCHKHKFDSDSAIEIYTSGRYFTFTEDPLPLSPPIREIDSEEFISLLSSLGYPWNKKNSPSPALTLSIPSVSLEDNVILQKMFAAKNGAKIKSLFEGDTSSYNNDVSSADFALCLSLAFWTGKNAEQIERLWLSSPLAKRNKTQEREDYRQRTILNAMEATQEIYSPGLQKKENSSINYHFIYSGGKDPSPILCFPNLLRVLRLHPFFKNKFRKNEFSHLVESVSPQGEWKPLTDDVVSETREFISENFYPFSKASKDMVTEAILRVAVDMVVNPPKDFLSSLVWDKTPRLNSWLHHTFGVPDDELHQSIGSNWLKGLIKRVMNPGCQFDEVLALEGPQGWRKSTSIRILGNPWHVETTHSIDNKDFYLILAQNIIVEFSEGEIFDRASVNKIKAEVTKTEDQVRPPYERGIVKFKRSCVFAVTTNKLELKDDTGNRRWLPVTLRKSADVEWLKINREQLFAEAYYRVMILGESTHEYPTQALEDIQMSRGEWSDYDEKVLFWYASLFPKDREEDGIALHCACTAAFGQGVRIGKLEEIQVSSILRRTLFLENKNKKVNGAVLKRWFPTEKTLKILKEIQLPIQSVESNTDLNKIPF